MRKMTNRFLLITKGFPLLADQLAALWEGYALEVATGVAVHDKLGKGTAWTLHSTFVVDGWPLGPRALGSILLKLAT